MLAFLKSMTGREVVSFCCLLTMAMYAYMVNVTPANAGISSSLASCAMAILTAGAVVKVARALPSFGRESDRS
ncbi:hypothetical protein EAH79_00565 [Sphingomonas koreensis]|nr:hypothetical protein EAH79_00565 [Sphingomonas koreensis]